LKEGRRQVGDSWHALSYLGTVTQDHDYNIVLDEAPVKLLQQRHPRVEQAINAAEVDDAGSQAHWH
jgi:hypothetical protein